MRYDKKVILVRVDKGAVYDPKLGEYSKPAETRTERWANVSGMSVERQQATYGDVKSTRLVVRLQREYLAKVSYIEIEKERYELDSEKTLRNSAVLIVVKNG